jgi:uncharacterized repeat protein (TIGR03803 family)
MRRCLFLLLSPIYLPIALTSALLLARPACAQTLTTLYSFTGSPNDGEEPWAGVVLDAQGNLYGTTISGGAVNGGTVFELTPTGVETVLHSFTGSPNDGWYPVAGLVTDAQGNLYGTTEEGGPHNLLCHYGCGTVFEISPSGTETVLHSFRPAYVLPILPRPPRATDGSSPWAGLVMDAQDNLYGTTEGGGLYEGICQNFGCGTVFELTPTGSEKALYDFPDSGYSGLNPKGGLVPDAQGNLYGTAFGLAAAGNDGGVVFKLTPSGALTVLYNFCQNGCADGDGPNGGLVLDPQGNIYGTTFEGGAYGQGTVFKITASGTETVLYSFCPEYQQGKCPDGNYPEAGLVMDAQGNLYGTTELGGTNYYGGTVFEVTASGAEKVLYNFCSQPNCADGANPYDGLVFDSQGNLYGTTFSGGDPSCNFGSGCGTVFKLTP